MTEKWRKAAMDFYKNEYFEKWRGSTMKRIILKSFEAGYRYGKRDGEE